MMGYDGDVILMGYDGDVNSDGLWWWCDAEI